MQVARDIVPIGDLKVHAARLLEQARLERRPIVITQHGRPAGVLLSAAEYDRLTERNRIVEKINRAIADGEAGRVIADEDLDAELEAIFEKHGIPR